MKQIVSALTKTVFCAALCCALFLAAAGQTAHAARYDLEKADAPYESDARVTRCRSTTLRVSARRIRAANTGSKMSRSRLGTHTSTTTRRTTFSRSTTTQGRISA